MAGVYFHIPFCKTRCTYCDFYSETNLQYINQIIDLLIDELKLRKNFLTDRSIETIYFGGGTPSLLDAQWVGRLIEALKQEFSVLPNAEITLEANPDDLSFAYLVNLRNVGVNRLSIGIQSFNDNILTEMNRRHRSVQAVQAVSDAQKAGFDNISVDLIYGWPGLEMPLWQHELDKIFQMKIQHISCYHLTYHENTALWNKLQQKKIQEINEDDSVAQYNELVKMTSENGFLQYEISNFSLPGFQSKHNYSYWSQKQYLGLGPSAHSFNTESRYWNVSNLAEYTKLISKCLDAGEIELLDEKDRFNDYVITNLRLSTGIDCQYVEQQFGKQYSEELYKKSLKYIEGNQMFMQNKRLILNSTGMFVSDRIMEDIILLKAL
jgi:oxygen-independent coproporphyrinogen III oxidase